MAQIKAKLPTTGLQNARNLGDKKEIVQTLVLVGVRIVVGVPQYTEPCRAVFYMGRSSSASVVDCALWVSGLTFWTSGRGRAGGYGYHKQSAALGAAINSAGIALYTGPDFEKFAYIDGAGESAMQDALYAIGEALGYDRSNLYLVRC